MKNLNLLAVCMMVFLISSVTFSAPAEAGSLDDFFSTITKSKNCSSYKNCLNQQDKYKRRFYSKYKNYKAQEKRLDKEFDKIGSIVDKITRIELRAGDRALTKSEKDEIKSIEKQVERQKSKTESPQNKLDNIAEQLADIAEQYSDVGGSEDLFKWAYKKRQARNRGKKRIR